MQRSNRTAKKSRKPVYIAIAVICLVAAAGTGAFFWLRNSEEQQAKDTAEAYLKQVAANKDFDKLFRYYDNDSIKESGYEKESAQSKLETIYHAVNVENIKVTSSNVDKKENGVYTLTYKLTMNTLYGQLKDLSYQTTITVGKDAAMIDWAPKLIFPGMEGQDKILVEEQKVTRGKIVDRNGEALALEKEVQQLGLNPEKLGEDEEREANLKAISEQFDVSVDTLTKALAPEWATGDVYVPIKALVDDASTSVMDTIPTGAVIGTTTQRYYPLKEAAASLIGYVGEVSAEDIEKNAELQEGDMIGKAGLEAALDAQLRGENGGTVTIADENGTTKEVLIKKDAVEPKDVTLTIDSQAQSIAFDMLENKPASSVVMAPDTGDLLAVVTSPSYDPNKMVSGISQDDYDAYANDSNLPFTARYATGYAPGSTFKTITAAIGLDAGTIDPEKVVAIEGLKWQKDSSWGDYMVTRVKEAAEVNLQSALVNSDNIYFAQQTLAMGEETFRNGLNKFIFGEDLDLPMAMTAASISNEDSFDSEILLADTGYGQGELLISPIQQAAMYSVFMNDGNIVYPRLTTDVETKKKEQVVSAESANRVLEDLVHVVSDAEGYSHSLYNPDFVLSAKTGTAEIKEKQDTVGKENSFLLFFDTNNKKFMGITMVEDSRNNGTATEKSAQLVSYLEETYQ